MLRMTAEVGECTKPSQLTQPSMLEVVKRPIITYIYLIVLEIRGQTSLVAFLNFSVNVNDFSPVEDAALWHICQSLQNGKNAMIVGKHTKVC